MNKWYIVRIRGKSWFHIHSERWFALEQSLEINPTALADIPCGVDKVSIAKMIKVPADNNYIYKRINEKYIEVYSYIFDEQSDYIGPAIKQPIFISN